MRYPLVLHTDDGENFGVIVPDMPGCYSAGDSVDDAVENAREAILLHAEGLLEHRQPIPAASRFVDIEGYREDDGNVLLAYADVDLDAVMGPSQRVNIMLKASSLAIIDMKARARGMNRSEYLAYAVTHFDSD